METSNAAELEYRRAMSALAEAPFGAPAGFADRVLAETAARTGKLRRRLHAVPATEVRDWARRQAGRRRRALASSAALVVGAVAIGLEARHLRRGRDEQEAA